MLVYAFRAGRRSGVWTHTVSITDVVEFCRLNKENWLKQREWFFEDLPVGAVEIVQTQLVIKRAHPGRPKVTHIYAKLEKSKPGTVFIGALEDDERRAQFKDAMKAWEESQSALRFKIKEMNPNAKKNIRWSDLSASEKNRIKGSCLSVKECWIWQPTTRVNRGDVEKSKTRVAPYRNFYIRLKGSIPPGVVLRHVCDNRMCMNPNHLGLGTTKDNVRDMMKRGRHSSQVQAKRRAKWRDAARRRARVILDV